MENTTQTVKEKEQKLKFNIQTFAHSEKVHKSNFKYNKRENKKRIVELKRKMKKAMDEFKEDIKELQERNKLSYETLTVERYEESIAQDKKYALERGWEIVEVGDETNIYSPKNIAKEKKKEFDVYMDGAK